MWLFGKTKKESEQGELPDLPVMPDNLDFETSSSLKRKNELPDLPPLPSASENELPELAFKEPAQEEMPKVKEIDYFSFPEESETQVLPKFRPIALTKEIEDYKPRMIKEIRPSKLDSKIEPIYIRIDKYQESLSDFQDIKKKLLEIENLLRDIKDIKSQEEAELQAWEKEISQTKEKLNEIDSTLFQKLD